MNANAKTMIEKQYFLFMVLRTDLSGAKLDKYIQNTMNPLWKRDSA
jgi:hypothetical protein